MVPVLVDVDDEPDRVEMMLSLGAAPAWPGRREKK